MKTDILEGKELALAVARCADEKQAEDLVVIDLRGISTLTDFFVIGTGTSMPHLKAIRREIAEKMAEKGPTNTNGNAG